MKLRNKIRQNRENQDFNVTVSVYFIFANGDGYPSEESMIQRYNYVQSKELSINVKKIKSICDFCKDLYLISFEDHENLDIFNIYIITDFWGMAKIKDRLEDYYES